MSHIVFFDTLAYAKKLKSAGFSEEQAEVQAEALKELIDDNLATKYDIEQLKHDLTMRLGAMISAGIVIVATLVKLL